MAQDHTDLVMKFTLDGQPVWAECTLDVASGDTFMSDFSKPTEYDNYSNFFEVDSFTMSMSLDGDDKSTGTLQQSTSRPNSNNANPASGQFARWRSATNSEYKDIHYPLTFDKFTFERVIDHASPIFFQCCCTSKTFDSAVLVKRVSQGQVGGTVRPALGYVRIEFTKVLITGIGWDDGDVVKESCEFICQKMRINYRKQKSQGTVDTGAGLSMSWPSSRFLDIRSGRG